MPDTESTLPTLRERGYYTTKQTAQLLEIEELTLRNWRNQGKGPPYTKLNLSQKDWLQAASCADRYPAHSLLLLFRALCIAFGERHPLSVRVNTALKASRAVRYCMGCGSPNPGPICRHCSHTDAVYGTRVDTTPPGKPGAST
jgi:hypothetical protein